MTNPKLSDEEVTNVLLQLRITTQGQLDAADVAYGTPAFGSPAELYIGMLKHRLACLDQVLAERRERKQGA